MVVVLDADGVVIKKPKVFSVRWAERNNIPLEKVLEFFKSDFQDCLVGNADLKETLPKWLKQWGTNEEVDSVLDFWFSGEADVNLEMIKEIESLRKKGMKCYLATNNEKYRVEYLKEKVGLRNKFDGIISSADMGSLKPNQDFYKNVQIMLAVNNPEDIWFWDDDEKNALGASNAGWKAKLFTDVNNFREEIKLI